MIPEALLDQVIETVAHCIAEAAPGRPFNGRYVTVALDGPGTMGILAPTGSMDPRSLAHLAIRQHASTLRSAYLVCDATVQLPDGTAQDAAVIEIHHRGEAVAFQFMQLYHPGSDGRAAAFVGSMRFAGTCPQLLGDAAEAR